MTDDGSTPDQSTTSDADAGHLGPAATWAMATGGMVGGGILSALGVVVGVAGWWAWLSFILAGAIAFCAAFSYGRLAGEFDEEGGAFIFLREVHRDGMAGSLSWILLMGYVLTMAVYAHTFGQYISHAFGAGAVVTKVSAIGLMSLLVILNLGGVTEAKVVEIIIVAINLVLLVGLAISGLGEWDIPALSHGVSDGGVWGAFMGAGAVFMAFEGFQLLSYDYGEIEHPKTILTPALMSAVAVVIIIYIAVGLAAPMLIGAGAVEQAGAVALAEAAAAKFGLAGLIAMTVAAACATTAAINSTLFATARLARRVADDGELPAWFDERNDHGIPSRAVVFVGVLSTIFAAVGSLGMLVEAASLAFLFAFSTVNVIYATEFEDHRWLPMAGVGIAAVVGVALVSYLVTHHLVAVVILIGLALIAAFGRPWLLKQVDTEQAAGPD